MNSYEIPYESFIGGWFISENICDKVISYFESKSDNHFKGNVGGKEYDKDFLDDAESYIRAKGEYLDNLRSQGINYGLD